MKKQSEDGRRYRCIHTTYLVPFSRSLLKAKTAHNSDKICSVVFGFTEPMAITNRSSWARDNVEMDVGGSRIQRRHDGEGSDHTSFQHAIRRWQTLEVLGEQPRREIAESWCRFRVPSLYECLFRWRESRLVRQVSSWCSRARLCVSSGWERRGWWYIGGYRLSFAGSLAAIVDATQSHTTERTASQDISR